MWAKQKQHGFTIVELLIVIVVIAILAAISIVAYNGVQERAHDARMRTAMSQFEKAIRTWSINTGEQPRAGWGSTTAFSGTNCADGSGGWVYSGAYACSLEDILLSQQLIPANFTRNLPSNNSYNTATHGGYAVMFYPCGANTGRYALYWHLRNPSSEDAASLSAVEAAGCPTSPRTNYMMRAAKLIHLN